jgi:Na+/phosphate symporter
MLLMSTELKAVSVFPSFAAFFSSIDCAPVDGNISMVAMLGAVGIGTVMTILVQSSAATIGLAIALANSGLLNIWTAIPIVLGDNIGTTITALIASVSANRTARQTALAHSMFNVLGSVIVLGSFYFKIDGVPSFLLLVNSVTSGDVFAGENVGRHVAMAHSIFNVVNVIIMTPFIGVLAWLCEHILPGKSVTERTVQLEMNLLNTPPLALFCAMRALGDMTEIAWKASAIALSSYRDGKIIDVSEVEKLEDEVDEYQTSIMDYMVQLTRKDLTEKQAAAIPVMMHCVNDAERISDLALIIARRSVTQAERCAYFSDDAQQELENLLDKAFAVANLTRESLQDGRFLAKAVEAMVADLKKMANEATQMHVNRLQKGLCTPERGLIYVEVISVLMHIVRHLENIAQRSDELTEAAT